MTPKIDSPIADEFSAAILSRPDEPAKGFALWLYRAGCFAGSVARHFTTQGGQIAELERRISELERQRFEYAGTFADGRSYRRNEFVTRGGSLWHCQAESTTDTPGTSGAWRLAVKRGDFAR